MNVNMIIAFEPEHPPMGPQEHGRRYASQASGSDADSGRSSGWRLRRACPHRLLALLPTPMGSPNMPAPSMARASGGKVYPKMDYASGGSKGRAREDQQIWRLPVISIILIVEFWTNYASWYLKNMIT